MHILFIGYGKTSHLIAKQLFQQGHQITTVSQSKKDNPYGLHLQQDIAQLDLSSINAIDAVYVLLSPKESTVEGYKKVFLDAIPNMVAALSIHPVKKVIVVSSTRVYGQDQAEKITDESEVYPQDEKAKILIRMEQAWQSAFPDECVIVRPTGIYGVSVQRMMKLAESSETYPNIHWSNRIHIEDLASFLTYLFHVEHPDKSYICSNNQPIPLHEIIRWFQKQLNLPQLELQSEQQSGKKIYATRMQKMNFKLQHQQFFADYQDLI